MKTLDIFKALMFIASLQATGCACRCFNDLCREPSSSVENSASNTNMFIGGTSDSQTAGALTSIHFEYKKEMPNENEQAILEQNLRFLQKNPTVKIIVEGHCDVVGGVVYNERLGKKRAANVYEYFLSNNISKERLEMVSMGSLAPLSDKGDKVAAKLDGDRRVNFVIKDL